MKKLLFCFLLVSAALGLKAQTLPKLYKAPKMPYGASVFKLDSTFKKYSVAPKLPLAALDTNKQRANLNKYIYAYDAMPIAKPQGNFNMPVLKVQSTDKMPTLNTYPNKTVIEERQAPKP